MSNSEDVSYSMDFEKEESPKPSRSESYSSVAESSRMKTGDGGDSKDNDGPSGEGSSAAHGCGNGGQDKERRMEELEEASDIIVPLSARSNRSETTSIDEDSKSTSSQQFSNAIERYEASLLRNDNSGPKSSTTELSDISEIMRQLDDMEKTRSSLENYLDRGTMVATSLKTIEELELQDSLASTSKRGVMSSRKSEASEIDEIDEIIKKLESLEKAQTALESALSKSEVESAFSTTQRPPASNPVTSKSTSRLVALNSLQQQMSISVREISAIHKSPVPESPPPPPSQPSGRQQPDIDTADEMSTISELNSARNQANDTTKPPSSSESSARSREKGKEPITRKVDNHSSEASSSRQETSRTQTSNVRKTSQKSSEVAADSVQPQGEAEEKLKNEITRQDKLISAYQKEIEHLYKQLSAEKGKLETKEKRHADEVNQLKTEIATMKVSHLIPVLPSSPRLGRKGEEERLREELNVKSNQMMGLRQEIASMKIAMKNAQAEIASGRQKTAPAIADKEKEYQKSIRALEKQVRTLQKMTFHKDKETAAQSHHPTSQQPPLSKRFGSKPDLSARNFSSAGTQTPSNTDEEVASKRQCSVLEQRVAELESELMRGDSDAREKVQEFQARLNSLTGKYEARINDLERKLSEAEDKQVDVSDMTSKLDRTHVEIANLKLEVARYKRENDILAKTSKATQSTSKKDANTLSLALKSFKAELAEKEKELVRLKKEMTELKKTNTSLKKERERYLLSANPTFPSYTRTKSDMSESPKKVRSSPSKQPTSFEDLENTGIRGSKVKVPNYTLEFLQSTLEEERREFENILKEKDNLIEKKEKEIKELEYKLDKLDIPVNRRDSLEEKNLLLEELRTRIQAQNKVIETLKNHLSSYSGIECELRTLRQEKGHLEFRIRELSQKLVLAKTLNKPEHEILGELMEKVESLSTRYFYREKQIDVLLNRLSTTSTKIPELDSFAFYPGGSGLGLDDPVSPTLDIHLADI